MSLILTNRILGAVQWSCFLIHTLFIIHRFHVCKFSYLLTFICRFQINIHGALWLCAEYWNMSLTRSACSQVKLNVVVFCLLVFSSDDVNKCLFFSLLMPHGLPYCAFSCWSLLFNIALKCIAEVLSYDPLYTKATVSLTEKIPIT
jgi:hypothetical protein